MAALQAEMTNKEWGVREIVTVQLSTIKTSRLKQTLNLKNNTIAQYFQVLVKLFVISPDIETQKCSSSFYVVCVKTKDILEVSSILGNCTQK